MGRRVVGDISEAAASLPTAPTRRLFPRLVSIIIVNNFFSNLNIKKVSWD